MTRRFVVAIGVSIFIGLVAARPADAQTQTTSYTVDQLQTYCAQNHGSFFDNVDNAEYSCQLHDGASIQCSTFTFGAFGGAQTTIFCTAYPPKFHLPNVTVDYLGLQTLAGEQVVAGQVGTVLGQVTAILAGQTQIVSAVNGAQQTCTAPDLAPVPQPAVAGPQGFCRMSEDGKLQVLVVDQGGAAAGGSMTRVVFSTSQGPMTVDVATSALAGTGGSELVGFAIPETCTGATPGTCDFSIGVDAASTVPESNETNNTVAGTCVITRLQ